MDHADGDTIIVASPHKSPSKDTFTNGLLDCTPEASAPTAPPKRGRPPRAPMYHPPTNSSNGQLREDFKDFGFKPKAIKTLMAAKENKVDSMMQRLRSESRDVDGDGIVGRVKRDSGAGKVNATYEPLFLDANSNWSLFDPTRGYPPTLRHPPTLIQRYAAFKPGNARIVEINQRREDPSLRLRSTPTMLQGKAVEYARCGPRIVDAKRRRGRPPKAKPHDFMGGGVSGASGAGILRRKVMVPDSPLTISSDEHEDGQDSGVGIQGGNGSDGGSGSSSTRS